MSSFAILSKLNVEDRLVVKINWKGKKIFLTNSSNFFNLNKFKRFFHCFKRC